MTRILQLLIVTFQFQHSHKPQQHGRAIKQVQAIAIMQLQDRPNGHNHIAYVLTVMAMYGYPTMLTIALKLYKELLFTTVLVLNLLQVLPELSDIPMAIVQVLNLIRQEVLYVMQIIIFTYVIGLIMPFAKQMLLLMLVMHKV